MIELNHHYMPVHRAEQETYIYSLPEVSSATMPRILPYTYPEAAPMLNTSLLFPYAYDEPPAVLGFAIGTAGIWPHQQPAHDVGAPALQANQQASNAMDASSGSPYGGFPVSAFPSGSYEANHDAYGDDRLTLGDQQPVSNGQSSSATPQQPPAKKNCRRRKPTNATKELARTHSIHKPPKPGPYECNLCPKSFTKPSDLRRHEGAIHRREKNFVCDTCSVGFARRDTLNRHLARKTKCKREPTTQDFRRYSDSFWSVATSQEPTMYAP